MEAATENLFNYLHDVIFDQSKAVLNIETLPDGITDLGSGLQYFAECVMETKELAQSLSKGILNGRLRRAIIINLLNL
ncbi:MAG: hypothetical protein FWD14_00905 [Treponema sp.]|nr:hypothetical protein [Treponema sp.]